MVDEPKEKDCRCRLELTRRNFLTTVGVGAVSMAMAGRVSAQNGESPTEVMTPEEMARVDLRVNGRSHRLLVEPRWSLLFVLRERLGLSATKVGCERGECGACTVLVGDMPRYACMILAVEAQEQEITTLEGLMRGEELGGVQQAFLDEDAYQCGYCTPGQIVAVEGLLRANPEPSMEEIRTAVSGNLCRCGAYVNIFKAAQKAAARRRGQGGAT